MIQEVFFAPHPPLAVHKIGQGNERRIQATLDGYHHIAKDIEASQPETIIYLSPHGKCFRDALAIINETRVRGDFALFGYDTIGMSKEIDGPLTQAVIKGFNEAGIPTVVLENDKGFGHNEGIALDHGVLVPMHFIDMSYASYKILHITTSFMTPEDHYKAGQALQAIVSKLKRRVVVVASGDLSHALKEEGPYRYNPFGQVFDEMVQKAVTDKDVRPLLALTSHEIDAAAQCGLGSFCMGFGVLEGMIKTAQVYSYEGPFGVGYLTGKLSAN